MSRTMALGLQLARPLLRSLPPGTWSAIERLQAFVDDGAVLHGSGRSDLDRLIARAQATAFGESVKGVFATRDPVWPMFYALVNRGSAGSLRTLCVPGRRGTRYAFSTEGDPGWRPGCVYVLPGDGFERLAGTCEWVNRVQDAVTPVYRVLIRPDDFPFLSVAGRHSRDESILQTWWRQRGDRSA